MIDQKRYVNIVSGVGAGVNVGERQLILRILTQNSVLPPGIVAEFGDADSVGAYFTQASEEYKRALAYFSFISKNIKSPTLISFARWVSAAIAPMVVGDSTTKNLASFAAITTGALTFLVGVTSVPVTGIDLSASISLTDVASKLQTAIRLNANPQLTGATVTYNTNTNQFVFTGTVTGSGTVTLVPGGANDISALLGWSTGGAVNVPGQAADEPEDAVAKSADISNNFGSLVVATPSTPLTNDQIKAIADWNHSQNNMYMYSFATAMSNCATLFPLIDGDSGAAMNVKSPATPDDYVEQSPCEILAATDYTAANATQNYMYYQFANRNATVSDDNTANSMDSVRANYIGVTQSAGQQLAFYQRGLLMGSGQAAVDMNTYANEMWLKSAIVAQILTMFLNLPAVPANEIGRGIVMGALQGVINRALRNGVISSGKTLSTIQQQYVTRVSADPSAWRQIQNIGYWLNVTFQSYTNQQTNLLEWKASYMLIYSKDDQIRFVEGQDIMI